jgi:catecholate siderophore receptor
MRQLRRSIRRAASRRLRRLLAPTVGVGLFLASSTAWAQTQPAPTQAPPQTQPQEDITLPGVDVRGQGGRDYRAPSSDLFKLPDLLKDTPQSITVVPQQIIREEAVFNLRDVLRNVTGISLAAGEGGGAQGDNLTLRGFSARNDIFIDGVRDIGQYSRDTFNLESVEVLRGPSSVMFGRGSTGGVINQVSKTPNLTPSYVVGGTGGSGPFFRGSVDLNQPVGDTAAFRLNAFGMDAGVEGREEVHIRRWGAAPSFTIGLGTPTRLTASYYYLADDNQPDYGFPYLFGKPAPVDRNTYYGLNDRDFEKDRVHIGTLKLEHALTDDVRIRNTLRFAYYGRQAAVSTLAIIGTPTASTPLSTIRVNRAGAARDQEDTALINVTDAIAKFSTFGLKHTLVTGLELGRETSQIQRFTFTGGGVGTLNPLLINPDPDASLAGVSKVTNFRGDTTAYSFGVFAVDELSITDWLKVIGGLRYDLFDADFRNAFLAQHFSRTDTAVSPRAALVVQPTNTQTYYFSYGTSFNPSAEALALAVANANIEPEKNETFEVGAKWDVLQGRLGLRAALFQIEKTNARTTDPALGVQVLEGRQRVRGFELEAIGRIRPAWNIFAGYTYLDSRVLEALEVTGGIPVKGKRIQNVPENTFSLWTTYDLTDQWQVGGGVIYVDQRFANTTNVNVAPSYVRADLTVAYRPIKPLELRMNVINLADQVYFDQVHPSHIVPGAARTFLFTGTWRF